LVFTASHLTLGCSDIQFTVAQTKHVQDPSHVRLFVQMHNFTWLFMEQVKCLRAELMGIQSKKRSGQWNAKFGAFVKNWIMKRLFCPRIAIQCD